MSNTLPNSVTSSLNEVYPVFEPNQLLTSNHLNQLRNYLDTQDRLSRIKLVGMGIVCGLEVAFDGTEIKLSKGAGITSEGFLITVDAEVFTKVSSEQYLDLQAYSLFMATEDTQIPMWELLPDSDTETPSQSLASPVPATFLDNKVVVLFMEYEDIDLETCLTQNCDDKGITRDFTVRKLLLNCADVDRMIRAGYGIADGSDALDQTFNKRFIPDYVSLPSFSLIPTGTPPNLFRSTYNLINSSDKIRERYQAIYPEDDLNPLRQFSAKLSEAYATYLPFVGDISTQAQINLIQSKFDDYYAIVRATDSIQYFYDFSKDVFKAYNEFIDGAFELVAECCPSEDKFPRHLVLAKLKGGTGCPESESACKPALYRTHFIQAPIYNQQKLKLAEVRNNFARLVGIIDRFDFSMEPDHEIKITPSAEKQGSLACRSIPFYYQPVAPLYKYWNYELAKKCKSDWNRGYWSTDFERVIPSSQNPLEFDMDGSNFFRIESIIGKSYKNVRTELENMKRLHQLDFEVLPLKLKLSATAPLENHCGLVDLKEAYLQKRNEIIAELEQFNAYFLQIGFLISYLPEILKSLVDREADDTDLVLALKDKYKKAVPDAFLDEIDAVLKNIPLCIDEFDSDKFVKSYKALNELVLVTLLELETIYRSDDKCVLAFDFLIERYLVSLGFIQRVDGLIDRLLSQIDLQLLTIHFSYLKRLEALQKQTLFSQFAAKNPGLTHMAGVPKGGTFLIVYDRDGSNENVIADFALNGKVCCEDVFPFCDEPGSISYPPYPRDIYVFVEQVKGRKIELEILVDNYLVDLNVSRAKLNKVELEIKSKLGAKISISFGDRDEEQSILYSSEVKDKFMFDVFDYEMVNAETGDAGRACVYVVSVPLFSGVQFINSIGCGNKVEPADPSKTEEVVEEEVLPEDTKPTRKWVRYTEILAASKDFFGGKGHEVTVVDDRFNETNAAYAKFVEEVPIKEERTPDEILLREKVIVRAFGKMMNATVSSFEVINRSLGDVPKLGTKAIEFRLKNKALLSQRDALVALYENQLETFMELAIEEGLGVDPKGDVVRYVDEVLSVQIKQMSGDSSRNNEILIGFSERDEIQKSLSSSVINLLGQK